MYNDDDNRAVDVVVLFGMNAQMVSFHHDLSVKTSRLLKEIGRWFKANEKNDCYVLSMNTEVDFEDEDHRITTVIYQED